MEAEFITRHDTYNNATAENEIAYMIRNNDQVSYHFAIDENSVVQGIPVNRNAWACGDGKHGKGNRKSISVEVCYSKNGGEKYEKANKLANKFIAQLLHERGWGVDRVKSHQFWSGKYCPHRILSEGRWKEIIKDIQKELDSLNGKKTTAQKSAPTAKKGYLSHGDKGEEVKYLQTLLNKAGANPKLVIDGSFGNATLKAVKDFQKKYKLAVDGFAGNITMQVLEAATTPSQPKAKKDERNFRLRTGSFSSLESYVEGKKKLQGEYKWILHDQFNSTFNPTDFRIVTGSFKGLATAEKYRDELRNKFGWTVYIEQV